jgi:hypothetical protein
MSQRDVKKQRLRSRSACISGPPRSPADVVADGRRADRGSERGTFFHLGADRPPHDAQLRAARSPTGSWGGRCRHLAVVVGVHPPDRRQSPPEALPMPYLTLDALMPACSSSRPASACTGSGTRCRATTAGPSSTGPVPPPPPPTHGSRSWRRPTEAAPAAGARWWQGRRAWYGRAACGSASPADSRVGRATPAYLGSPVGRS